MYLIDTINIKKMDTENISMNKAVFIALMAYTASTTVITIIMVAVVCFLARKKHEYCCKCRDNKHKRPINNNGATATQTHQDTPSQTGVEDEKPNKTLTITKSLPIRIDHKEEIGFYSYAYDEIQYPIAVRNGHKNIRELFRDSDPTYAKFVTLPSSFKSRVAKKSYGSQDHLQFLTEFQQGDDAESSYLKARTFVPTENCPQNLRLLVMEMKRRDTFLNKIANDVLL